MLKSNYLKLVPDLKNKLGLGSVSAVPKVVKVVLNVGAGKALIDPKLIDQIVVDMGLIAGQKPVVTKAKKAIAGFKIRENNPIGVMVTLRGQRMYDFLDKLIHVTLPRVRDFQGLPDTGFDGQGNYNMGIKEHIAFPEIVFENVDKVLSLQITIVTTAKDDEAARMLLTELGLPLKSSKATEN